MRYAIVDTVAGRLLTVVEYTTVPANPPPGYDAGIIAVQSDTVGSDWTWNGNALVASVAAPLPPTADPIDIWDMVSLRIAFNHENRIRALEGKAAITLAQFKAALRVLIGP